MRRVRVRGTKPLNTEGALDQAPSACNCAGHDRVGFASPNTRTLARLWRYESEGQVRP